MKWDTFLSTKPISPRTEKQTKSGKCGQRFRHIVMITLFLAVLLGGVVSLISMLLAATNLRSGIRLICEEPGQARCVSVNIYLDPYEYGNDTDLMDSASCLDRPKSSKIKKQDDNIIYTLHSSICYITNRLREVSRCVFNDFRSIAYSVS